MSRLEVKIPGQAQAVVEQLYRNMERRIAASPPGLCPVDMALTFLDLRIENVFTDNAQNKDCS